MNIENIRNILHQFGGPIKLSYQTTNISNVSIGLVDHHLKNINDIANYDMSSTPIFGQSSLVRFRG